jgi:glutaredoxin-related protein
MSANDSCDEDKLYKCSDDFKDVIPQVEMEDRCRALWNMTECVEENALGCSDVLVGNLLDGFSDIEKQCVGMGLTMDNLTSVDVTIPVTRAVKVGVANISTAAKVMLESSGNVIPKLTKNFTMRCSLSANSYVVLVLIAIKKKDGSVLARAERRVGIKHYLPFDPSKQVYVMGSLQGTSDYQGFLEIRWESPSVEDVTGDYHCFASGMMAASGVIVGLQSNVVTVGPPDMSDLASYISKMEENQNDLKSKIQQLSKENNKLKKRFKTQANKTAESITTMKSDIDRLNHIESGTVRCSHSRDDSWPVEDYRDVVKNTKFAQAYEKPPVVFLSVERADFSFKNVSMLRMDSFATLDNVGVADFTVRCSVFARTGRVGSMWVRWVSFSNYYPKSVTKSLY